MSLGSCIYAGQVYHKRTRPREHTLKYSVFTLLIDLAELDLLPQKMWLFSRNRFNLFGFYDKDFGENPAEPLPDYVHRLLRQSGIHTIPTRILLSCYPRMLGYVFNPISLFYCLDKSGGCFAVIHEVHNTFGERHAYVLPVSMQHARRAPYAEHSGGGQLWIEQAADKELFVSPFAHMGMQYKFRLNNPDQRQIVIIRASDEDGLLITASYTACRQPLTARRLGLYFLTMPLMTMKVLAGIHWEAMRLWLKGVPLFKHLPKRSV